MRKKTEIEMQRAKVAKVTRTLVRLKHSLAADQEINDVLPDTLSEFNAAVESGQLLELTTNLSDEIGAV